MQTRILFVLLILGTGLVLAPAESAAQRPRVGGTLTMGVPSDLGITNPLVNVRSTQGNIYGLIYEPLLTIDVKGNIKPNLAESWQISPDGKVIIFSLRRGVTFHDGKGMTSEDIKFAMDYVMNPKNGAAGFNTLKIVEQVEVLDKHVLRVRLKAPSAAFLASLTVLRGFSVIPKGSLPEGVDMITTFPAGTGPFKFVEWRPSQQVVLQRHDGYWGHKAFIDTLVFKLARDDAARFVALRAGDVDIIERASLEWAKQVVEGKLKGIGFAEALHSEYIGIQFNVPSPPFDNKKLRQAVTHAIDKKEVFAGAYLGFGETTDQKYPRGHIWYIDEVKGFSYNPAKAGALLKEAGYNGQTIKLTVNQERTREAVATIVQAQLKRIGMNVEVEVVESSLNRARARRGEFQFRITSGSFYPDPSDTYGPDLFCPEDLKRRINLSAYCDREIDALLQKLSVEHNVEKRRALVKQIVAKTVEDAPFIHIGYAPVFYTFRDYVKGFSTDGDGSFRHYGGGLHYTWLEN